MSNDNIYAVVAGLLSIVVSAAVVLWGKIIAWSRYSLFPWIEQNYPHLRDVFENAFVSLDRVVAPLRAAAINAWKEIRKIILKATQTISERSDNVFVREFCAYVIKMVNNEPQVSKIVTVENIDLSEVPSDVREQFVRLKARSKTIDVTAIKDQETGVYEVGV